MSKVSKASEPEITTATLSEDPTVPEMDTGGVGQVAELPGARQTVPVAACAGGIAGTAKRAARIIMGSMISGLM
jgi:hypothetical protein